MRGGMPEGDLHRLHRPHEPRLHRGQVQEPAVSGIAETAALVWYVTGRFYKTPSGDLLDVGYFLHLQGIEGALFDGGTRSESTALFTFASAPFQTSTVDNGGLSVGVDDKGSFSIYLRDGGGATFDDPSSF